MLTKSLLLPFACLTLLGADMKTISGAAQAQEGQVKTLLLRTAEKMPEENYSFKPTADVRSFGEIIGHLADSEAFFCAAVSGTKPPETDFEKNAKTKAELIAALKQQLDACDKVFNALTDKSMIEVVKVGSNERTRGGIANFSLMHSWEHYGNLVTYMRLKGIVPPSSEPK